MNREILQNEGEALISHEGVARNRYGGLLGLSENDEENGRREEKVGVKNMLKIERKREREEIHLKNRQYFFLQQSIFQITFSLYIYF